MNDLVDLLGLSFLKALGKLFFNRVMNKGND